MGPRSQEPLPEVTRAKDLALTQRHVPEVGAGRTALMPPEGIKLPVIHKVPLLHQPPRTVRLYYFRSEAIGNGSARMGGDYDRPKEAPVI